MYRNMSITPCFKSIISPIFRLFNLLFTITSTKKGYEGNYQTIFDCDSAFLSGNMTNGAVGAAYLAGGVEGGLLYKSANAGLMTLTNPYLTAVVQEVGFALEADKYFFNPKPLDPFGMYPIAMPTKGAGFLMTGSTP